MTTLAEWFRQLMKPKAKVIVLQDVKIEPKREESVPRVVDASEFWEDPCWHGSTCDPNNPNFIAENHANMIPVKSNIIPFPMSRRRI